ncbi:MAG: hypothetical protein ACK55I_30150, partial [bacterium]
RHLQRGPRHTPHLVVPVRRGVPPRDSPIATNRVLRFFVQSLRHPLHHLVSDPCRGGEGFALVEHTPDHLRKRSLPCDVVRHREIGVEHFGRPEYDFDPDILDV